MFKTFYKRMSVSHSVLDSSDISRNLILEKLANTLAEDIVHSELKTETGMYHNEYEMRLIVATPEDFHKMVHEQARKLSIEYPIVME